MKLHRLTAQLVVGAMLTLPLWVYAAGLGKLTVKSALGQPLSAEIELLVANKAELDSLNASLASGQAYKDAQIEFAPVLSTLQFQIAKRTDGRPVLKVTSSKPVNEPFVDMLVELNWASGRLLREYTVLLDPPGMAVPQTVAPVEVRVPETRSERPATQVVPKPTAANPFATAVAPAEAEKPAAAQEGTRQQSSAAQETSVRVKRGDTLSGVANRVRPASVSLEQALVSLFRENPAAFAGNNMNRLKAGQLLQVPSAEAMASVEAQAARNEVSLHAADWHAYRAKLAAKVAEQPAQEETAGKTVVGKITPKVEDQAQPKADAGKDVLKLSRADQDKGLAAQEDSAARENALKESGERAAELEKQIQDMQKLAAMKEQEASSASAAEGGQQAPDAEAKSNTPPPIADEPQTNWYDELLENPIYWTGGAAIVVLGGLLWWMLAGGQKRRKPAPETASGDIITGGELQPSTVQGAEARGGVVNTGDTSFLTDFSQAGLAEIDTHDVDPIAEADVYMAYGRDAQAEEILKEALTKTPDRHEIRLKLLEIYAARKNVTSFETVAGELYAALGGQTGAIWDKAAAMGRSIDPHNPLYGGTAVPAKAAAAGEVLAAAEPARADAVKPQPSAAEADATMEFSTEPHAPEVAGLAKERAPEPPVQEIELDFSVPEVEDKPATPAPAEEKQEHTLDFDLSGFDLKIPEQAAAPETPKPGTMDFSGLDLDLTGASEEEDLDEVATKLDLARAYLEMGDKEGAREILQEVVAEGTEKQKNDAQSIMATL